ncbi:hypothetical protein H8A95_04560 [Bradyrhizobium sp. Pear76]|uniref:hypothetical protein n=1 Tax=Bradyrhizobium oropedii TaxID=1571201 RepID=UPI001E54FCD7|nr:hypothetical protein [Bradyrhizobium oropedii]MCC8961611.1 hypothetical protein [Bradyrhizobium oropedii]
MDASIISGFAALAGAAIGGLTSAAAAWFTQRNVAQIRWVSSQALRRQDLYRDFIEVAAKCYMHALQHDRPDVPGVVQVYSNISRMRALCSSEIVETAEDVAQRILAAYARPDKSFIELRAMVNDHTIDLLHDFSQACRLEQDL